MTPCSTEQVVARWLPPGVATVVPLVRGTWSIDLQVLRWYRDAPKWRPMSRRGSAMDQLRDAHGAPELLLVGPVAQIAACEAA